MNQKGFREEALKKLSSPEQLDELIQVTPPRAWMALIGIILILLSAVVWGFLGSIPTKISGQGILLNNGGVTTIEHQTSGIVIDLRYHIGDMVKKGDVIARIEIPEIVEEINSLRHSLNIAEQNSGIHSPEYQQINNKILQLREELEFKSQVTSEIDGRIIEMNIDEGSAIQAGDSLVTLEQYGDSVKLEAVIYVPAEQGGKILPGMEVQISPTIVNKEEYGFMLGRVQSVSKYTSTTQSMLQTLGNEKLVSFLAGNGAPLMIKVDLIRDENTVSGYKWSSSEGPPISIQSGTIIQSDIVINREKPINKVIPLLEQ